MQRSDSPSRLQTAATLISSVVVLLPLALAKLVELYLKSTNPDQVDVTQGLAYLRPILVTAWTSVGFLIFFAVSLNILCQRRGESARVPWMVLGAQLVLGLAAFGFQLLIDQQT